MRKFSFLLVALVAITALSACSFPLSDDVHMRGRDWGGDHEYVAMDNAIYDTLVEMYGKDRVELVEAPEVEMHRWVVRSDVFSMGHHKQRTTIEARPYMSSRMGSYYPDVRVSKEISREPWGRMTEPRGFGADMWVDGGKNTKLEAKIYNAVEDKMRAWKKVGRPATTNRRDEYLTAMDSATKTEASGK